MKQSISCKTCGTVLTQKLELKETHPADNVQPGQYAQCMLFTVEGTDPKKGATKRETAFALQRLDTTGMIYEDKTDVPLMTSYSGKINCLHCRTKLGYRGSLMGTLFVYQNAVNVK